MQHRIWDQYDALSRPDALAERLNLFGTALGHPITFQQIEANDNLRTAFEGFVQQREHEELSQMLAKLEALNPKIAAIRFDRANTKHLSDVVHGVVSGFHPDCIDHYINFSRVGCLMDLERHPAETARRALESRILNHLGESAEHTVGWIASIPTLERIWEQIKGRPLQALEEGLGKGASHLHL